MKKAQKRNYSLLVIGSIFYSIIPITTFILFMMLLIHTITKDPEALGYVILFLAFPTFMIITLSIPMLIILFITLKPSFYKGKQKNIVHLIIGCISILLSPLYIYFISFIMKTTFLAFGVLTEFVDLLESDVFHPVKLIYGLYCVGPVLLLLGGLLAYLDHRMQQQK